MPYRLAISQYSSQPLSLGYDDELYYLVCRIASTILILFPDPRNEEHEDRIELKTSCQHVKHKDIFGQGRHIREISGRSYRGEAGTDVVEGCGDSRKVRDQVEAVIDRQQQDRRQEKEGVSRKVCTDSRYDLLVRRLPVKLYDAHAPGVDKLNELPVDALGQDDHPGDLETAAGRACAGSDEHQQDEDTLRKLGPQVKVHRPESGRRDNRGDLKCRVMNSQI